MDSKIRVLAKPGLDGHGRGAKVIVCVPGGAGMEAIHTGPRPAPGIAGNAALAQDAPASGRPILPGAHRVIVSRVLTLPRDKQLDGGPVVVGGMIPDDAAELLKKLRCGGDVPTWCVAGGY